MDINDIVAENIFKTLTDKQKQQIVADFVKQQINASHMAVRNKLENLVAEECIDELERRRSEIREIVSTTLNEKLTDKNFFQTLAIKHKYKNLAKSILEQL